MSSNLFQASRTIVTNRRANERCRTCSGLFQIFGIAKLGDDSRSQLHSVVRQIR